MHLEDLYRRAALAAPSHIKSLFELVQKIPLLSVSHRKDLLTLCRCQHPPIPKSAVEKAMKMFTNDAPIFFRRVTAALERLSFRDWIGLHVDLLQSPAYSGFVSMMLRVAPGWNEDEVESLLRDTLHKELTASINIFPNTSLDYRVFFGHKLKDRYRQLAPNISPYPECSHDTFIRFYNLRRELDGKIFYPDYSRKTTGREVSKQFWEVYDLNPCFELDERTGEPGLGKVALIDLEKMWDAMGIRIGGAVELRRAWKYNDLKPRAYFARGGTIHWVSRHIQPIVNIIIDSFPEVARKDRFSDFDERFIDDSTSVFIYDYTSFTSSLEELNSFIPALADFFRGVTVRLYDIRNGIEEWDLGEYLLEYLEEANLIGRFLVDEGLLPETKDVEFRNTCGMLGVPGNIFLATLLHGLHLRFIAGIGRSKCVGDDAKAKVPDTCTASQVASVLSNLGEVHPDKTSWFTPWGNIDLERYQYIKRPFYRDENIMMSGHIIVFPSFVALADDPDPYHTVVPNPNLCNMLLRGLMRFMDQVFLVGDTLTDEERFFCRTYAIGFKRMLVEYAESRGEDKSRAIMKKILAVAIPSKWDFGLVEPKSWIIGQICDLEPFEFPMPAYSSGEVIGYPGNTFVRGGSKLLSYLEDMGYVESSLTYYSATKHDLGSAFYETYFGLYSYAKSFTVLRDLPSHAVSLLNT